MAFFLLNEKANIDQRTVAHCYTNALDSDVDTNERFGILQGIAVKMTDE